MQDSQVHRYLSQQRAQPVAVAAKYVVTSSSNTPGAGSNVTITAQLADINGNPVSGSGLYSYLVAIQSGRKFFICNTSTSTTNVSGAATVVFTVSTISGTVTTVTATDGSSPTPFTGTSSNITTIAGTAANMVINGGNNQTAIAGSAVATPPSVLVTDQFGNVVSGASVNFAPSAGGSVTGGLATTNASGIATVGSWTLAVGANTLTASATGVTPVIFNATGNIGAATKYLVTSSNNGPVAGSNVTITAQLADANGNAVTTQGLTVTWTQSNGAGGSSFATATSTTDVNGIATVVFTTSTISGTVTTVTATDNSSPTPLTGTSANITTVA